MRAFLSPMKEMPVPTNHLRGPDFSQMDTSATSLPGLSRIEPITAGPEKLGLPQVRLRVSQVNSVSKRSCIDFHPGSVTVVRVSLRRPFRKLLGLRSRPAPAPTAA